MIFTTNPTQLLFFYPEIESYAGRGRHLLFQKKADKKSYAIIASCLLLSISKEFPPQIGTNHHCMQMYTLHLVVPIYTSPLEYQSRVLSHRAYLLGFHYSL